jgi:hypothetical protein
MFKTELSTDEAHLLCWAAEFGRRFCLEASHDAKLTQEDRNYYRSLYHNLLMLDASINPGEQDQWRALKKIANNGTT